MKYECKYCRSEQTGNVLQDMINDFISSGRVLIDSSGNEEVYRDISWCKCRELWKLREKI